MRFLRPVAAASPVTEFPPKQVTETVGVIEEALFEDLLV